MRIIQVFFICLAILIQSALPAVADVSSLIGIWKTQNGSVIEFNPAGDNVEGRLVEVSPSFERRGFSVGDRVAHEAEVDGDRIQFQLAVRTIEPHPECPPAFVLFEGRFSEDRAQLEGFRRNVKLSSENIDACQYMESPSFVEEAFLRIEVDPNRDEYSMKSSGKFFLDTGEKEKSLAKVTGELGKGFEADVRYSSDSMKAAVFADSATGVVHEEMLAFKFSNKIDYDLRLRGPTEAAVKKFLEVKALHNAAITAGDPPGEGTNLAWQPAILCSKAHDPNPGKPLYIAGSFSQVGKLEVFFQQMHEEVVTENKKTQSRWVIDRKVPARILGRRDNGITVQIPQVQGKVYIVVKIEGFESVPYEYKVLQAGLEVSGQRRLKERLLCQLVDQVMLRAPSGKVTQAFHVFTRKKGKFRYRIGSKSTKVKVDGKTREMRWIFHLNGEYKDGYKNAVFNLGVSLVPKGREEEFLKDPEHPISSPVSILKVVTGKDEKSGKKFYKVEISNDGLASLVGVRWDKKTRQLTLSDLAGVDLKKLGVQFGWDNKKDQVFFKAKTKLGELEILGNKEGGSARFTETEDRIYDGNLHRFRLTSRTEEDKVFTVLKNEVYRGNKDTGKKFLSLEMAYDSSIPEGEPNPNLDAKIELFDYSRINGRLVPNKSVSFKAGMRENKLHRMDVDFTATKDRDVFSMGYGYLRQVPGSNLPNQRRWETRLGMQNRFADGDLKVKSFATMQLDTRSNIVDAMTVRLGAKAKLDKGLNWGVQVDGAYTRRRRPTRGESWEVNITGSAEKAKVEAFIRFKYRQESNERDLSIFGGIESSGIIKGALKVLKAKKYQKREWKIHER